MHTMFLIWQDNGSKIDLLRHHHGKNTNTKKNAR